MSNVYLSFLSTEILEFVVAARLSRSICVLPTDVHCPTVHVPIDSTCLGNVRWYPITTLGKVTFHDIETVQTKATVLQSKKPPVDYTN